MSERVTPAMLQLSKARNEVNGALVTAIAGARNEVNGALVTAIAGVDTEETRRKNGKEERT